MGSRLSAAWGALTGRESVTDARLAGYARWKQAYEGFRVQRSALGTPWGDRKPMKFNLCRPICDMAGGWVVGPGITWKVESTRAGLAERATRIAMEIWDRSGGDSEFLSAAHTAVVCGDMAVSVSLDERSRGLLRFLDPSLCEPEFDPHDCSRLERLTVAYRLCDGEEYREIWDAEGVRTTVNGQEQDFVEFAGLSETPAVWIANGAMRGEAFGHSELAPVIELIEEFDHVAAKQTRIIDYYARPTIWLKNVRKGQIDGDINTVVYLPQNAEIGFLEWRGTPPSVEQHLQRIREAISEVSQTPAIAFGQVDRGFTSASGVSLRVLYGPLEEKTRRKRVLWGPRLERAMWMALRLSGIPVDPEHVSIVWGQSSPVNELEALEKIEAKQRIGISLRQALLEANYSQSEVERMLVERESD